MNKLASYPKKLKISIIILMVFLIIIPLSGIIFDLTDRLLHYDYFHGVNGQQSQYTIDQLFAWMFVAFTNWYAMFCVLYGTIFLAKIGFKTGVSEYDKYIFNIISLGTYSTVVAIVFWPDVAKQLVVGEGFIFTNSWIKNIVTINIHLIAPAIAFAIMGIFSYYEKIELKKWLLKQSWFMLIVPVGWLIYSWSRLAIYVNLHGFDPNSSTIVWWNSYSILNPYANAKLAIGLVFVALITIYGIGVGLIYLNTLSPKIMQKFLNSKIQNKETIQEKK